MLDHSEYMLRCLQLAGKGSGYVAPNPMVGCVIVKNGKILAEGFHHEFGGPHAEAVAINSVNDKNLLSGSSLYVNLEPCSHHGKTPPCSDLIIANSIKEIFIGSSDPNPLVAGKGIQRLNQHGVSVTSGILKEECDFFNRRFLCYHNNRRPYIILKWAQSADGFMDRSRAEKEKGINWISSIESRRLVHQWRSEEQSILVGKNTVLRDDPSLDVRHVKGPNPVRFIIDKRLEIEPGARVYNDSQKTFIYNALENAVLSPMTNQVRIEFNGDEIISVVDHIYKQEVISVIVEGGSATLHSFIEAGLWDEARIIKSIDNFGNGLLAPQLNSKPSEVTTSGTDHVEVYYRTTVLT